MLLLALLGLPMAPPSDDPPPPAPVLCSVQTILLAFVAGTLFLNEDKGLQPGPDGVLRSLTSANAFLGISFFSLTLFVSGGGMEGLGGTRCTPSVSWRRPHAPAAPANPDTPLHHFACVLVDGECHARRSDDGGVSERLV